MFGFSTAKLIGFGIGALALIAAFFWIKDAFDDRAELRAWQDEVVTATREAAANPKLGADGVPRQVTLLGQAIKDLKAGIAKQNAEIARLGVETKRQQDAAAIEQKRASQRAQRAEGVADRLKASSRSSERLTKPCLPSEELKGAWR